jgi:predicted nucleic acid-binding protein
MPHKTPIYGIDTSIFVRLLTGHPEKDFEHTVSALEQIQKAQPYAEFTISNQVIGEAYIALQFHYKINKADAREAILKLLTNGMFAPLNGESIISLLKQTKGCGLVDRLIVQDYEMNHAVVLTNDRRMSKLQSVRLL